MQTRVTQNTQTNVSWDNIFSSASYANSNLVFFRSMKPAEKQSDIVAILELKCMHPFLFTHISYVMLAACGDKSYTQRQSTLVIVVGFTFRWSKSVLLHTLNTSLYSALIWNRYLLLSEQKMASRKLQRLTQSFKTHSHVNSNTHMLYFLEHSNPHFRKRTCVHTHMRRGHRIRFRPECCGKESDLSIPWRVWNWMVSRPEVRFKSTITVSALSKCTCLYHTV